MFAGRRSLLWLFAPFVFFLAPLPLVNRVHPVVLGMPFFTFWTLLGVVATPALVWLAARGDPLWSERSNDHAHEEGDAS